MSGRIEVFYTTLLTDLAVWACMPELLHPCHASQLPLGKGTGTLVSSADSFGFGETVQNLNHVKLQRQHGLRRHRPGGAGSRLFAWVWD